MTQDQANLLQQLKDHPGFKLLNTMMQNQFEAYKNELEDTGVILTLDKIRNIQGRLATYRDIFNYLKEAHETK